MRPVVRVEDAGRVQLGRQRAPKYQTGKFTRPYVRVANVFEDRIDVTDLLSMDFGDRDFAQYRLEHGDILLNEGQSTELVGRPAMWRNEVPDCCFQNTIIRFQPDKKKVLPDFALGPGAGVVEIRLAYSPGCSTQLIPALERRKGDHAMTKNT